MTDSHSTEGLIERTDLELIPWEELEAHIIADLPDRLRERSCPAGEPWTGDDPASNHGHTDNARRCGGRTSGPGCTGSSGVHPECG